MKPEHNAHVVFRLVNDLLIIRFGNNGEEKTIDAERWLDYIGNIFLICCRIKVFQTLAACIDVLGEVVVGSVGNAPQLAPAEREKVFKISGSLGIEAKLFF